MYNPSKYFQMLLFDPFMIATSNIGQCGVGAEVGTNDGEVDGAIDA